MNFSQKQRKGESEPALAAGLGGKQRTAADWKVREKGGLLHSTQQDAGAHGEGQDCRNPRLPGAPSEQEQHRQCLVLLLLVVNTMPTFTERQRGVELFSDCTCPVILGVCFSSAILRVLLFILKLNLIFPYY